MFRTEAVSSLGVYYLDFKQIFTLVEIGEIYDMIKILESESG